MTTRLILTAPCGLKRVDGEWVPLGAVEFVAHTWHLDADRVPDGEPAGLDGRYAYPRGYRYEVTPAIAASLEGVHSTAMVNNRTVRRVHLADWVRTEEIPVPYRERTVSPAMAPFTAAQEAAIERLMDARMAELGVQRQDVSL